MRITLYHGSDVAIEHPDVTLNTGFSDLGRGFYLTDDHEAARGRARSRARQTGAAEGIVSVFDLDVTDLAWVCRGLRTDGQPAGPFGLCFEDSAAGIRAWVSYIKACRQGATSVAGLGEPAVVRAWIATEEVELVCSGLAEVADVADYLDPTELVVQYCLRDQAVTDARLTFVEAEVVVV